jgi:hypothetical protein
MKPKTAVDNEFGPPKPYETILDTIRAEIAPVLPHRSEVAAALTPGKHITGRLPLARVRW